MNIEEALRDALDRTLRMPATPVTSRRGLGARLRLLEKEVGGPHARRDAARQLGVTPRTWERWIAGTMKPGPANQAKLDAAAERAAAQRRLRAPKMGARFNRKNVRIHGTQIFGDSPAAQAQQRARGDRWVDYTGATGTGVDISTLVQAQAAGQDLAPALYEMLTGGGNEPLTAVEGNHVIVDLT